jgi:hypothetical protein
MVGLKRCSTHFTASSISGVFPGVASANYAMLFLDHGCIDWLYPDYATQEGGFRTSIHILLVQTPSLTMIVDAHIDNDRFNIHLMLSSIASSSPQHRQAV